MPPSVSRRSILRTSGVVLSGAVAGCSGLSTEDAPPTVPIFLENRDEKQHSALVQIHSVTQEEAFAREISISPGEIVKAGEVTTEEFCIRGQVSTLDMDNTCPTQGEQDYSQHGFMVVIYQTPPPDGRERRVEIVKIQDADVQ